MLVSKLFDFRDFRGDGNQPLSGIPVTLEPLSVRVLKILSSLSAMLENERSDMC